MYFAVEKESWETQDSPPEQEEEEPLRDKYYDKAKCFFDNVSSDLKPRWPKQFICNICFVKLCNILTPTLQKTAFLGGPPGLRRKSWT